MIATQGANSGSHLRTIKWNSAKEDNNVGYEYISCYSMDKVEVMTGFHHHSECAVGNDCKISSIHDQCC